MQATTSAAVENLQRYLRHLSFYDDSIPTVAIDGIYDERTREAVMAFQRTAGLEESGIVDYTTWTLLFEAYVASLIQGREAACFDPFPRFPASYSVGAGNHAFLVEIIQYLLNELTLWMDDIPRNAQSGVFDRETEQGVLEFQRAQLLEETGRVDRMTWNALLAAYGAMAQENA